MSVSPTPDTPIPPTASAVVSRALAQLADEFISARDTRDRFPGDHSDGLVYGTFRALRVLVETIEASGIPGPELLGTARSLLDEEGQR